MTNDDIPRFKNFENIAIAFTILSQTGLSGQYRLMGIHTSQSPRKLFTVAERLPAHDYATGNASPASSNCIIRSTIGS